MYGRGDASAAAYEDVGGELVDGHDGRASQEPAVLDHVAHALAGDWDYTHGGRLVVHDADGHLVRDNCGDGLCRGRAGDGDHVYADRADARPRFQFIQRERAELRGLYHRGVLADGDERAAHTAHGGRSHRAALLHGVREQCERGRRPMRARALEAQSLYYLRDRVAGYGRRRETKVYDAEAYSEAARGLPAHELARARELEGELLYQLGDFVERRARGRVAHGMIDDAGAGDADVYDRLRLAHAVERARHKGIVLERVGDAYELRASHP